MTPLRVVFALSVTLLGAWACSDPVDPEEAAMAHAAESLQLSVKAERTEVTPGDPVNFEVSAENVGSSSVQWGPTSSSCQLWLVVRVDGEDRHPEIGRGPCTLDLTTQTLEPGESRTETMSWGGRVQTEVGGPHEELEPGMYEVRGFARPLTKSDPIVITVVEE